MKPPSRRRSANKPSDRSINPLRSNLQPYEVFIMNAGFKSLESVLIRGKTPQTPLT